MEQGISPEAVSEVLGHTHVAITLDRYSHVSPELQRAAADARDALLGVGHRDEAAG